jgi:hypothetical protein
MKKKKAIAPPPLPPSTPNVLQNESVHCTLSTFHISLSGRLEWREKWGSEVGVESRVSTRETREGWPLLLTEANGDSWSTNERVPSLVGTLGLLCRYNRFFTSPSNLVGSRAGSPVSGVEWGWRRIQRRDHDHMDFFHYSSEVPVHWDRYTRVTPDRENWCPQNCPGCPSGASHSHNII